MGLQRCGPRGSPGVTSHTLGSVGKCYGAPRSKACSKSYGAPKSRESPLARFRDFHSGVPREKSHLDVGPVERSRVYYKGEDGGFPQVWAVVSLVCPCCSWLVLAPKVLQLRTNHFVWVVCRPV
jgi:hypothetical protein